MNNKECRALMAGKKAVPSFLSLFCALFLYALMPSVVHAANPGDIVTIAGGGTGALLGDGGLATSATLSGPAGVSVDASGNIYIADFKNNRIRMVLATTAAPSIHVTDSIPPTGDLLMSFGSITTGTSSTATVTISNTGNATLTVMSPLLITGTDANQFSLNTTGGASPCNSITPSLAAGSNCTLTVTFSPTSTGAKSATLAIASDDLNAPTVSVSLSGTGTAIPAPQIVVTPPTSINFGNVTQGMVSDQTVTITNNGNAGLTIGQIGNINPLVAPFSIPAQADTCSNKTIAPASTCTLIVRFAPTKLGTIFSDHFNIPSNDLTAPNVTLSVSGASTNAPPTAPILVSPANGLTGLGTTVTFKWQKSTDPDGDPIIYHLYTSTDPSFTGVQPKDVKLAGANKIYFAGLGTFGGLMMIGMVFVGNRKGRKGLALMIVIALLATGLTLVSCGGGGGGGGGTSTPPINEVSYNMTVLSGATYYWKVVADDGKGGTAESETWSFSTK